MHTSLIAIKIKLTKKKERERKGGRKVKENGTENIQGRISEKDVLFHKAVLLFNNSIIYTHTLIYFIIRTHNKIYFFLWDLVKNV